MKDGATRKLTGALGDAAAYRFGAWLLKRGLVGADRLREALAQFHRLGPELLEATPAPRALAFFLVASGACDANKLVSGLVSGAGDDSVLKELGAALSEAPCGEELDGLLGWMAVARGWVSVEELREAMGNRASDAGNRLELAQVLLRRGRVTTEQLLEFLEGRRRLEALRASGVPSARSGDSEEGPRVEEKAPRGRDRIGRYEVLREIGRGGMGEVYEAFDPELGRKVALKVLFEEWASPHLIERLHREATAAARLHHPNIVAVHEVGVARGVSGAVHFIAMDFISGRTLAEVLPGLSLRDRVRVLEVVARAVGFAHENGILHRDLKPENILMAEGSLDKGTGLRWRIYLTDFGLARIPEASRLTDTGTVMGTPVYMAPEQVRADREAMSARTDVWALGVILYEMLAEMLPFNGRAHAEIYGKILRSDPAPPRRLTRGIPADLEAVCLKAIEKEPRRRYADASELAEDLHRWLAGDLVRARPPTWTHKLTKRVRRNPWAWSLGASAGLAAMLALAAGLVALVWRAQAGHSEVAAAMAKVDGVLQRWRVQRYTVEPLTRERRELDAAIRELRQALEAQPGAHWARAKLGQALREVGRPEESASALEIAANQVPSDGRYRWELAKSCYEVYRRRLEESRRYDEADRVHARQEIQAIYSRAIVETRAALAAETWSQEWPAEEWERSFIRAFLQKEDGNLEAATAAFEEIRDRKKWGSEEAAMALGVTWEEQEAWGRASESYESATQFARSYAPAYAAAARVQVYWANQLGADVPEMEVPNARIEELYEGARQSAEKAVAADPEFLEARLSRVIARKAWADHQSSFGQDAGDLYQTAENEASEALRLDAASASAYFWRGSIRMDWAVWLDKKGEDPTELLAKAFEDLAVAARLNIEEPLYPSLQGTVMFNWARAVQSRGEDPTGRYRSALNHFSQAAQLDADVVQIWLRRGWTRTCLGAFLLEQGDDPSDLFRQAIEEDFARALSLNPESALARVRRGQTRMNWGLYLANRGEDPETLYRAALRDFTEALDRKPRMVEALINRGLTRVHWGIHLGRSQADPRQLYREAIDEDLRPALEINPRSEEGWGARGRAHLNLALYLYEIQQGGSAEQHFADAVNAYDRALERNPRLVVARLGRGLARVNWGILLHERGADARPLFEQAIQQDYLPVTQDCPSSGEAWFRLGKAALSLGLHLDATRSPDLALASYRQAENALLRAKELPLHAELARQLPQYLQMSQERLGR